ncbi:MAG: M28 family peptidase [Bacteroidetes bacterium]|nr:M28 family peptidase [Bacteroidota bacterium]
MKKLIVTLQLLIVFFTAVAQDSAAVFFSNYISPSLIKQHLEVLASDSLEGRETAAPGMVKAANYVSSQYEKLGLPTLANGTRFQEFPLVNLIAGIMTIDTRKKSYKQSGDFFFTDNSAELQVEATDIVFVGYGIVDSTIAWNDYSNVDVNGKVVMLLEGEPLKKDGSAQFTKSGAESPWSSGRQKKIQLAKDRNAKAVLFVQKDYKKNYERISRWLVSGRLALPDEEAKQIIPVAYITPEMANDFLQHAGYTVSSYEKRITKKKKSSALTLNQDISISSKIAKTSCRNVLGYVEGSSLKDEVIVISAHLDHLGKRGDKIYYILFLNFSGEEKGLLGSEFYTKNPVFPLEKTVANLNIDMIGRLDSAHASNPDYTYIIGSDKLSTQLHRINEDANKFCCNLDLDYKYNDPSDKMKLYYRSDHYNFAKNKIPVIFYFTGIHDDYHKPTDTIDKIDFDKTSKIAKLVFNTAWQLANRPERIVVDVENDFKE